MPWLWLAYGDNRVKKIITYCDIKAVPVLAVINKKGEIVTLNGKRDVC